MRLPNSAQSSPSLLINEIAYDFRLEDVWALPTPGGPEDFPRLVQLIVSGDLTRGSGGVSRLLFAIRWRIGSVLGWDGPDDGRRPPRSTLRDRLPKALRVVASGPDLHGLFTTLYLTEDEWAAEIVNRTVHGVMHLSWVSDPAGGYRGQMAVYVKPNGLLGTGYMAAITPFRRLIVYPQMMRQIGRQWRAGAEQPASLDA